MEFEPHNIPRSFYVGKIRELAKKLQDQRLEMQATEAELAWWERGLDLFGGGEGVRPHSRGKLRGHPPATLRMAILQVMFEGGEQRVWRPAEVIVALQEQGWLPEARSAAQMVRNRLLAMAEKGEVEKHEPGGYYRLAAHVRNTGVVRDEPEGA